MPLAFIDPALLERLLDKVPVHYVGAALVLGVLLFGLVKGWVLLIRELRGPAPVSGETHQSMRLELREGFETISQEQAGMRAEIRDCRGDIRGLRTDVDTLMERRRKERT